jgi:hypothetical protein
MMATRCCRSLLAAVCLVLVPLRVFAQDPPSIDGSLEAGTCVLLIRHPAAFGGKVQINGRDVVAASRTSTTGEVAAVPLQDPLHEGDDVRLLISTDVWTKPVRVVAASKPAAGSCGSVGATREPLDERPDFYSTLRTGFVVETFAPQIHQLTQKLFRSQENKQADEQADGATTGIAGRPVVQFDANYRVPLKRTSLWLYSQARYGARKTTVCVPDTAGTNPSKAPTCDDNGVPNPGKALAVVRLADTAEFYLGGRYEFATVNRGGESPANFFVNLTYGSLFVLDLGDVAFANHKLTFGFQMTGGRFRDSFVEAGSGVSGIFTPSADSSRFRFKSNVLLVFDVTTFKTWDKVRPFISFSLDQARGADSYLTVFGAIMDVGKAFGF